MTYLSRFVVLGSLGMLGGCGLVFGRPMTEDEFVLANDRCGLDGATLVVGSYLKGQPSIIEAPKGLKPGAWDGKTDCVARLFGGDGFSKAPSNSFMIRFKN